MLVARLFAIASLVTAVSLSSCTRSDPSRLTALYPTAGKRVLEGPGFALRGDGFTPVEPTEGDPLRAAAASLARRGGLRMTLPERGTEPVKVSLPGLAIEVRERGLVGPGRTVGGALAYPRADGTSWWTATDGGFEEWVQVESAGDGPVAEWQVSGATLRQSGEGAVAADAAGVARVRITAPRAYGAGGLEARAWLRVDGDVLSLHTDARGPALVDPVWTIEGALSTPRADHSATLLPSGKVLVAGGSTTGGGPLASAELYDPATRTWSATDSLNHPRLRHAATLLPTGEVLVVGGEDGSGAIASAELYDPASGTWTATGALVSGRSGPTATLLATGKVLIAGGSDAGGAMASAELYDRGTGAWASTGSLAAGRASHTATRLPSGKVLIVGGHQVAGTTASELYDPATGTWSPAAALGAERYHHSATLLADGRVLVAAGATTTGTPVATASLYDPTKDSWSATGSLGAARLMLRSVLLPSGMVLAVGGRGVASAELYDPGTGTWSSAGSIAAGREAHTVTMLPSGDVLVAGGHAVSYLATTELYDPASGTWTATGELVTARCEHTATLLPSGKVLVTGGRGEGGVVLASAELYDPAAGTWAATGSLLTSRYLHTATLLRNGKVLVAGGLTTGPYLTSSELYDPETGTWSATGSLPAAVGQHTATLLPSGKVLVASGRGFRVVRADASLYDPATGAWTPTGALPAGRVLHTATLLPAGKVLVAGGTDEAGSATDSSLLYDPATGTWTATGSLASARSEHTATLLPSGKVLVAGGEGSSGMLASAELYDPIAATWGSAGAFAGARALHAAALLPSGKVAIVGGRNSVSLASVELYDPVSGTWYATAPLVLGRNGHKVTLLPSGMLLVSAGYRAGIRLSDAELYDEGRGALTAWRPAITAAQAWAPPGGVLNLIGTLFTGLSEGSGGSYQTSAANYPLVELRDQESGAATFLPLTGFTATSADASLPGSQATGRYWLSVIVNGIPSDARALRVDRPPAAGPTSASTPEDTPLLVALDATDPDGDAITCSIGEAPLHGEVTLMDGGSVEYRPAADYHGPDAFTFTVSDGSASSAPATVSITVSAVNDAPVAQPGSVTTTEDTATGVTLAGTDVDGDPLTYAVATQPAHGTVTLSGADVTYTPTADFSGSDGFTFTANDGAVASAVATVTVTVTPVNDAPVAHARSVSTKEGTAVAITLTGTDADGDPLTYAFATQPAHGAVTLSGANVTYTPTAFFTGVDEFTFTVSDGTVASAPATVSVVVSAVDDAAKGGCSCGLTVEGAPLGALLLGLLASRRRPRAR